MAVSLDDAEFVLYCCPAPGCHFGLITPAPTPATTQRLRRHLDTAHPGWTITEWRAYRTVWSDRIRRAALN